MMKFNEAHYLLANPDVAEALRRGEFSSAREHFELFGRDEKRIHCVPDNFDEDYYVEANPDVAAAIICGNVVSGAHHWLVHGRHEQRRVCFPDLEPTLGGGILSADVFRYQYDALKLQQFKIHFSEICCELDIDLMRRLSNAYILAVEEQEKYNGRQTEGMWSIHQVYNSLVHNAAIERNYSELSDLLSKMFVTNLTHGVAMGGANAAYVRRYPDVFSLQFADRWLRLTEALGLSCVRSPEQGILSGPLDIDFFETCKAVEQRLGFDLTFPNVGGQYGIKIGASSFPDISLTHLYAALRIISGLDIRFQKLGNVFEIGGGFGGLAFFLERFGLKKLTIFDLPLASLMQGYFLSKANLSIQVSLYGEPGSGKNEFRILPWWTFFENESPEFDLAINQDSIPEMPSLAGERYIQQIANRTKGYFYSLNQEHAAPNIGTGRQLVVPELCDKDTRYSRQSRDLFWLRDGYVEEWYKIKTTTTVSQ
jgi:hypothetical protein